MGVRENREKGREKKGSCQVKRDVEKGRFIESWVVVVSVEAFDISYNIPTR